MTRDGVLRAFYSDRPGKEYWRIMTLTNLNGAIIVPQDAIDADGTIVFDVSPEAVEGFNIKALNINFQVTIDGRVFCLEVPITSVVSIEWLLKGEV